MRKYGASKRARDPFWLTSKFDARCIKCGATVRKGDKAWYLPSERAVMCETCGRPAAAEFSAAAQDEAFMQSQFPGGHQGGD